VLGYNHPSVGMLPTTLHCNHAKSSSSSSNHLCCFNSLSKDVAWASLPWGGLSWSCTEACPSSCPWRPMRTWVSQAREESVAIRQRPSERLSGQPSGMTVWTAVRATVWRATRRAVQRAVWTADGHPDGRPDGRPDSRPGGRPDSRLLGPLLTRSATSLCKLKIIFQSEESSIGCLGCRAQAVCECTRRS